MVSKFVLNHDHVALDKNCDKCGLRVGCGPVVPVAGKFALPTENGGVVEDQAEGDRVAVGIAKSEENVLAVELLPLRDEEIRPAVGSEDGEDVKEIRCERGGELGDGEVELGSVGTLLPLGVGGFDLDPSGLTVATVRDQEIHSKVERGQGNNPMAHEQLRGNGVFACLASEEVGADICHVTVLMAANSCAPSRSWTLAAI